MKKHWARDFQAHAIAFGSLLTGSTLQAQVTPTITLQQGSNGALSPVTPPSVERHVYMCESFAPFISAALPAEKFINSLGSIEFRHNPDSNWDVNMRVSLTDNPTKLLLALCGLFVVCPVPPIDVCGPEIKERTDYHSIQGGISSYVAMAGGGFSGGANFTKIADGTIQIDDVLEITSPAATVLELPTIARGDVLAAESFGDPAQTWGKASIELSGSIAGESISDRVAVESESVIPATAAMNTTRRTPIVVGAGVSHHEVHLTAKVHVEVKATSAGFFGTITGAATAAANFGDSIHIGRITGLGDTPLPVGTRIVGLTSGIVYEEIRCCAADFDRSGGTPDGTDIAAFFDAWLAGQSLADADCSGGTPDTSDIAEFFSVWLAGGCG